MVNRRNLFGGLLAALGVARAQTHYSPLAKPPYPQGPVPPRKDPPLALRQDGLPFNRNQVITGELDWFIFDGQNFRMVKQVTPAEEELLKQPRPASQRVTDWAAGRTRNGECPDCGTMAPPLHGTDAMLQTSPGLVQTESMGIVRCKRCNAAFWQDAEEPKK